MTLGKIEIVAACNRGDGEDQSKWQFTEGGGGMRSNCRERIQPNLNVVACWW